MLLEYGWYLAVEPVTTTVALIALGKALGLFGAAAGGSIAGQYAAGNKGKKAVSRGMEIAVRNFSVASTMNNAASGDDAKKA